MAKVVTSKVVAEWNGYKALASACGIGWDFVTPEGVWVASGVVLSAHSKPTLNVWFKRGYGPDQAGNRSKNVKTLEAGLKWIESNLKGANQ